MAISKNKKSEAKEEVKELTIKVDRAKDFTKEGADGCNIAFDMEVNGVKIYGCWYREGIDKNGKEYAMVSFPSKKDEKSGKYFSHAFVKLSDADVENISKQIEAVM